MTIAQKSRAAALLLTLAAVLCSCGAVFLEVGTPVKQPRSGRELSPPAPDDLVYLEIKRAKIPDRTRDGRSWGAGNLPDPFAIAFVGDRELFRTSVQSQTLTPTWPDQPRGNYRVPQAETIRIEIWASNALNNHRICSKDVRDLHGLVAAGEYSFDLRCEGGTQVEVWAEPAHPQIGLGMFYEIMLDKITITRVYAESPAARAGIGAGDTLLEIMDKRVSEMEDGEAQSLINSNAQEGVKLWVRHQSAKSEIIVLKEGALYPIAGEFERAPGAQP